MFDYEYWGNETFSAKDNMALEEFFLKHAQKNAVIRFFDFPQDSVILGYAQHTDAIKNSLGAPVARRLTGGAHVQVGLNTLVYSFAVPRSGEFITFEDMRKYYAQHVADALEAIGNLSLRGQSVPPALLNDLEAIVGQERQLRESKKQLASQLMSYGR